MGRPSWATKVQTQWLESRMQAYLAAQSSSSTAAFLLQTFQDFVDRWPIIEVATSPSNAAAEQEKAPEEKDVVKSVSPSLCAGNYLTDPNPRGSNGGIATIPVVLRRALVEKG